MSCIYSTFNGECTMDDGSIEMTCSLGGYCMCEDDPNPEDSCEYYEEA